MFSVSQLVIGELAVAALWLVGWATLRCHWSTQIRHWWHHTHSADRRRPLCHSVSHSECWEIILPKKFRPLCLTTDNKSFRRNLSFANPPRSKSKPLNDSKVKSDQNLHCCDDYQIQNCSEYLISEGKVWIMYLNNCKKVRVKSE